MSWVRRVRLTFLGAACFSIALAPLACSAQQEERDQEIIANLAAGKVVIWVARDGTLIGTAAQNVEPGSFQPLTVRLDTTHVGVLLGALEWTEPGSGLKPTRLDTLLGGVSMSAGNPLAKDQIQQGEASDIENLGIAFLECIRTVTSHIHHKLDLKPDEPLITLLIVDYAPDYGPEVWRLGYGVKQTELRDDFWDTLALRPSFEQLYPPEKHDPKVLVEYTYPGGGTVEQTLNELLGQNDPRLKPIRASDPKVAQAAQNVLDGASNKAEVKPASVFLAAALQATSAPKATLTLAVLYPDDRFDWVLAPPEPLSKSEAKRDSDAPSLKRSHP